MLGRHACLYAGVSRFSFKDPRVSIGVLIVAAQFICVYRHQVLVLTRLATSLQFNIEDSLVSQARDFLETAFVQ
jgi:hypothetical protein